MLAQSAVAARPVAVDGSGRARDPKPATMTSVLRMTSVQPDDCSRFCYVVWIGGPIDHGHNVHQGCCPLCRREGTMTMFNWQTARVGWRKTVPVRTRWQVVVCVFVRMLVALLHSVVPRFFLSVARGSIGAMVSACVMPFCA